MFRRNKEPQTNYLDYVPSRAIDHVEIHDGLLVLLRPKFTKGLLAKYLQPEIKKPYFRVRLDAVGSATWRAIDGKRTVGQIAELLHEQFGDEVEPRYERCSKFINSLHRGEMVTLMLPDG